MELIFAAGTGVLAIIVSLVLAFTVYRQDRGNEKMIEISDAIKEGAMAFLNKEYKILSAFVVIVAAILYLLFGWQSSVSFLAGAVLSAIAGNIGMRVATSANSRTTQACRKDSQSGFRIAFRSGAATSFSIVGLGLIGLAFMFVLIGSPELMFGFGFGASSIALFARVGGGIYTKAADIGADIVGKVEASIPEDDPRNPAVIADNVGDNVGDVAGMGADLFESYVDSIIAAMALGVVMSGVAGNFPLMLAGAGIIASIIGLMFVRRSFNKGIFASAGLVIVFSYFMVSHFFGDLSIFYSVVTGLVSGIIIGLSTEYYTSDKFKPVHDIANSSLSGPANTIIDGLSLGMLSTIIPVIVVSGAILLSYHFSGLYGIAIAAVGMLSTLGITLAADTYGPVADNAAGIAEMSGIGGKVRKRAEELDAIGNTTAAIGKGFAISSAALTALALFAAFVVSAKLDVISITTPTVVVGLFIGGLLPFVFSGLTMKAVGKAAKEIVTEVRNQFKNKDILKGKKKPDYGKVISISTESALKEMMIPAVIAILAPIVVGVTLGPAALGGLLAGSIVTGFMLAVMMANTGGAWDNAKKYIESGKLGGKGSDAHKAAVVGDTVGDPLKDTSGPSLNILIKLMAIVSLVVIPLIL